MGWMMWGGVALTLVGIGVILYCGVKAGKIKSTNADEEAMRAALQRLVAVNLGGLALAALGLMTVIMGIVLG